MGRLVDRLEHVSREDMRRASERPNRLRDAWDLMEEGMVKLRTRALGPMRRWHQDLPDDTKIWVNLWFISAIPCTVGMLAFLIPQEEVVEEDRKPHPRPPTS